MTTKTNAILCPASGMTCHNYACRQFGCVTVGSPHDPAETVRTLAKPARDRADETARN